MQGVDQKVVEIHGVVAFELVLIFLVDPVDDLAAEVIALGLKVCLRTDIVFFLFADCCGKVCLRIELRVNILLFHDVFYQRFLIDRIVNDEIPLITNRLAMLAQNPQTHRVEGHDPHPGASADQLLDTLTHLSGSLIREGHCQNLIRAHALFDQIGDAVRHGRGLAAARACQNQQRPVDMRRRLALLCIQML